MTKKNLFSYTAISILLIVLNCKEPFDISTNNFESVLVVEATITNEMKHQEVNLSLTNVLEDNEQILVTNAQVWIEDSNSNNYSFTQNNEGVYLSDMAFKATENNNYTLNITTPDGNQYKSSETLLTPISEISRLYPELTTVEDQTGIHIFAETDTESGLGQYFRYEFEETYKIVVPNPSLFDFELNGSFDEFEIITYPREEEGRTCYTTNKSNGIILRSTNGLIESNTSIFHLNFIEQNNPIIRERYSILVKQYVQSLESYTYYRTIKELGTTQGLLSTNQTGFVNGNLSEINNPNKKVLGYFDVTSASSTRIYFNYSDFNIQKPPYFTECEAIVLDYTDNLSYNYDGDRNERSYLYNLLSTGYVILFDNNPIFEIIDPACGDCSSFSSNITPDFWEE